MLRVMDNLFVTLVINASPPRVLDVATPKLCTCIGYMMQRVLGNILCNLGQDQIMYFLENEYPP